MERRYIVGDDGNVILLGGEDSSDDEDSFNYEEDFNATLRAIKENNVGTQRFNQYGDEHYIQNMSDEDWEELGRDIAKNTHLTFICLHDGALNDQKLSFFFSGLTRSSSIKEILLYNNHLSAVGVRSMVPFLQNANNLQRLQLGDNNIQSEGFNLLLRALRDSPIEELQCGRCGIESIEIDIEHFPKRLRTLSLKGNSINSDGCQELAKLLQGGDATMEFLQLENNMIADEGVSILVNALQNNKSLTSLYLQYNGLTEQGEIMLLKLVNDISSIEATLQSNHTLTTCSLAEMDDPMQDHIDDATRINIRHKGNTEAAGREKVIQTQLDSMIRAQLAELQGVTRSVYSEINPLHLPEVLSLIGNHHDEEDLYIALKSSIAALISTVNVKEFLQQQRAYYRAKLDEIEDKIAAIEAAESLAEKGSDIRSGNKKT